MNLMLISRSLEESESEFYMRTADDIMKELSDKRQKKINNMASELIAEEMTLRDLRKALKRTQVNVANNLSISQNAVSKLEKRTDLLLSTLTNYVNAMGGELKLVAEFPDRPPVTLSGLVELEQNEDSKAVK